MVKNKSKQKTVQQPLSDKQYFKQRIKNLPLADCYISESWDGSGVANVIISRKHSNGNISASAFYVDTFCEGIIDCVIRFNNTAYDFEEILKGLKKVDYEYAHNLIYTAAEYAIENGLKNHKDFEIAQFILEEDTEDFPFIEIEMGKNGKPLLLLNPNGSNASKLVKLRLTLGEGNFNFVKLNDDGEFDFDDDESEDYDEEDDDEVDFEGKVNLLQSEVLVEFVKNALKENDNFGFDSAKEALDYAEEKGLSKFIEDIEEYVLSNNVTEADVKEKMGDMPKMLSIVLFLTETQDVKNPLEFQDTLINFIRKNFFHDFPDTEFDIDLSFTSHPTDEERDRLNKINKEIDSAKKSFLNSKSKLHSLEEKYKNDHLADFVFFENYIDNVKLSLPFLKKRSEEFPDRPYVQAMQNIFYLTQEDKNIPYRPFEIKKVQELYPEKLLKLDEVIAIYESMSIQCVKNGDLKMANMITYALGKMKNYNDLISKMFIAEYEMTKQMNEINK